jgi:hypothetical protein
LNGVRMVSSVQQHQASYICQYLPSKCRLCTCSNTRCTSCLLSSSTFVQAMPQARCQSTK